MTMRAYPVDGGDPIEPGQELKTGSAPSFFVAVTREPHTASSGRVALIGPSKLWPKDVPATYENLMEDYRTHSWPERTANYGEYFPHAVDLVIR